MKYTLENHPKPKFITKSKEVFINGEEQIEVLNKYISGMNDILKGKCYEYRYKRYSLDIEKMQMKEKINQINKTI